MEILSVENVSKYYGEHCALDDISIRIPDRCIFGLLGPNGAGKTSLIRIINQITAPDKGKVYFQDEEMRAEHISRIGYLPEERGLYPKMRVAEQIIYLARLKGLSKQEAEHNCRVWLRKFDLEDRAEKTIEELSKGLAQKVQFITTIIHKPRLIIFDEPFTGFDPINTNLIKKEILRLREEGATVIFSTHRMESVEEICDRIALMNNSKLILEGELHSIKDEYKSNIFVVEMRADEPPSRLPSTLEILGDEKIGNKRKLRIRQPENDPNSLLAQLMNTGEVYSFHEEVPSLNDIFIQKVESR